MKNASGSNSSLSSPSKRINIGWYIVGKPNLLWFKIGIVFWYALWYDAIQNEK